MKLTNIFLIILFLISIGYSQEERKSLQILKSQLTNIEHSSGSILGDWTTRRITGMAYSLVIPGTGQFYLGHRLKGSLFTLGFSGALITSLISANNFNGNKERIDNLKLLYNTSDRFSVANDYWKQLEEVYDQQKSNATRRDIFMYVTISIWLLNIADYLFLSEDLGVSDFSYNNYEASNSFNFVNIKLPINF